MARRRRSRRSRRRRRPWPAPTGAGRVPCALVRVEPGSTRCHTPSAHCCDGPRRPTARCVDRLAAAGRSTAGPGATSWRCCAETPRRGRASTPAWPADCGPGSRTPPTRSSPAGASTPRRCSSGRASCSVRRRSTHGRDGGESLSDEAVLSRLVHALFRQLVHTGDDRRPAARRARGTARRRRRRPWSRHVESLPGIGAVRPGGDAGVARGEPARPGAPVRTGVDATDRRPGRHPARRRSRRPARGLRLARRPAATGHRLAVRARRCRPADRGPGSGGRCTISRCSRRCAAALPRSAWRCSNRPPVATASRTCARSTSGPSPRTSPRGSPATTAGND